MSVSHASYVSERDEGFFDEMINFCDELNSHMRKIYQTDVTVPHNKLEKELYAELFSEHLRESTLAARLVVSNVIKNVE